MRFLAVTGTSGGHIFPALSFLNALKDKNTNIDTLLVLPQNNINYQIDLDRHQVRYISAYKFNTGSGLKKLISILKFLQGTFESLCILLKFKPDIVVGFGSIYSVAPVLFAWLFRIKTLIHEQNVVPGRANRFLARFVDKIAISFKQTTGYFRNIQRRIVFTGNPIRQDLKIIDRFKALNFFGFQNDRFTILVMGGSQGSQKINQIFRESLSLMADKGRLQIIHIAGSKDYDLINNAYKDLNLKIKIFSFLKQIHYAYSISDLAITRAGACTIAELIKFALPAVIIPYPFALRHQLSNAKVLEDSGSAILISEDRLNAKVLKNTLEELVNNQQRVKSMRLAYLNIQKDNVNNLLVDEALALLSI